MANGTLSFSLIFEAVTRAFNAGVREAAQNYRQATGDMGNAGTQLGQRTAELGTKLQDVFKAGNAKDIINAFRATTAELNNTRQGATLTTAELSAIGRAGKAATTELNAALRTAQAELKALQQARATPTDLATAKAKVAELRTELAQSSAEYSRLQAAATAAMRRAAAETQNVDNASRQAGSSIYNMLNIKSGGQLRTEIAAINQQLAAFRTNASVPPAELSRVTLAAQAHIAQLRAEAGGTIPLFGQMANVIRNIGPAAAVLTGVSVGLASIKEGVEAVIAATVRYEATMKQLEFGLGGITRAKEEYQFLLDITKRLGLDLEASSAGFAKLTAATKGTALEGEQTRVIFEGVAAAAASLNLSASDTSGMMLALSQIISKGKVSMEELRGQLGERLPGAMFIAAQSVGMTTAEFEKLVEGGIDSILFMEKFGPAMVAAFGPTAAQNVNSLAGQINLLKNEFELLLVKIGKEGVGQAAVAVFQDLRGSIERVNSTISDMDPTTVAAVEEAFKQLYDLVGEVFFTLLGGVGETVKALNELINGVFGVITSFAGLDQSNEQVGLLTRSIQGITVLLGILNDGVKGTEIAFTLAIGTAQSFFSAVAFGLSKITFGDLSRELEQFAFDMQDKAQTSFEKAGQKALEFQSSAVAAADAAITAHTKAGEEVKKAHTGASNTAQQAQGQIGDAGKDAANTLVTAHTGAADKVVAAQGQMATAAQQAKEIIELASVEGEKAIVSMFTANQAVIRSMQDLAKESGIALPAAKLSAVQVAEIMGEVAAKSDKAADAIGKNLKNAIDNLGARDFVVLWDGYIKGLEKAGANTDLLNKTTVDFATQASKLLGGDLAFALGRVSDGFSDNIKVLDKLISSMDNLKKQGVDTGVALSQSLDGMLSKAKNPTEITKLIGYWENLGKQGTVTGQQMNEGLEKARQKLDEVKPGINSVNEALRTLGQTGNDSATNIQNKYTEAFRVLRESGQATFVQITQSLKVMFDAANDTKSLDKLKQLFQDLGGQGKLASYDVKQGLADIQNKMDGMKPGINSLAESFKAFGMITREEAAAMADKYGQAFQVMKDSGQATKSELQQAFTTYAEAAVKAAGGVVDSFIQAQAAAQGLSVRVDETGKVIVEAMGAGVNAINGFGVKLDRAIDQYGKLSGAAQAAAEAALAAQEKELQMQERLMDAKQKAIDLENRRRQVDKDGFSTDSSGSRINMEIPTWLSTLNQLKGWGVDDTQANSIANKLFDDRGNMRQTSEFRRDPSDTFGSILRRMAEDAIRNSTPLNNGGTAQNNNFPNGGATRTTTINLKHGDRSVGMSIAPNDEQKLLDILDASRGVA